MSYKKLYRFGDKLEDKIRGKLSHYPIIYALIGGVGIVIFWRGVWHSADSIMEYFFNGGRYASALSTSHLPWWDGPLSMFVGVVLLLLVGLFVSNFIGNEIIISGLKGDKKIAEKTEQEVKEDMLRNIAMSKEIKDIARQLDNIEKTLNKKQI